MGCACCHRSEDAALPRPLRLCSLHHSLQFPGFLSRLFPCFILFPSSLLLPSRSPRFGAGNGLHGVLWWKRGRDVVLRAGFLVPVRWKEEVRRLAAG